MEGWMGGRMNGRMDGGMNEWKDGWGNELIPLSTGPSHSGL